MSRSQMFWIKCLIAIATCGLIITTISTFVTGFEYYQPKADEIQETSCTADSCTIGSDICSYDGKNYYECYQVKIVFHSGIYYGLDKATVEYQSKALARCDVYYSNYTFTCYYQQNDIANTLSLDEGSYYSGPILVLILLILGIIGFGVLLIWSLYRYSQIPTKEINNTETSRSNKSKETAINIPMTTTPLIT